MSQTRTAFVEKLMDHIGRLRMVPKAQVERALAPILGLYIDRLLSQKWGKRIETVCEEFPLRKASLTENPTHQSTDVDWLLYDHTDGQLVFVELKTSETSFDSTQEQIYCEAIQRLRNPASPSSFLIEDLREIMRFSLQGKKYAEVLKRVEEKPCWTCMKAKLVYIAPACLKKRQKSATTTEAEWLAFRDLPQDVDGELDQEWRVIYPELLRLDSVLQHGREASGGVGRVINYADACNFDEILRLCQENGDSIVVRFSGGPKALRAATLDELQNRREFKWDRARGGKGAKGPRSWITGQTFLNLVEPLLET